MNKEQILLEALNEVGDFKTVSQEFNSDQLGAIYAAMDSVKVFKDNIMSNLQADIRNKLSPLKNLIAMINKFSNNELIKKQIPEVKKSIKYLSNFC